MEHFHLNCAGAIAVHMVSSDLCGDRELPGCAQAAGRDAVSGSEHGHLSPPTVELLNLQRDLHPASRVAMVTWRTAYKCAEREQACGGYTYWQLQLAVDHVGRYCTVRADATLQHRDTG